MEDFTDYVHVNFSSFPTSKCFGVFGVFLLYYIHLMFLHIIYIEKFDMSFVLTFYLCLLYFQL